MNIIASDFDKISKRENLEVIASFFQNLNSKNTMIAYRNDLRSFMRFLSESKSGVHLFSVSQYHISSYKQYLFAFGGRNGERASEKTVSRKLACLYSFYEFLVNHDIINKNPVKYLKRPKIKEINHTEELNRGEVEKFYDAIKRNKSELTRKLHLAIATCFFERGLRRSELINLNIEDFKLVDEVLTLSFVKKGGERVVKKISKNTTHRILEYLECLQSYGVILNEKDPLFRPTKNNVNSVLNKRFSPSSINYIFQKYSKLAGIDKNVTPHSGRATLICNLLDSNAPSLVQGEVDHKNVSTTLGYDQRRVGIRNSIIQD